MATMPPGVLIYAAIPPGTETILTPGALRFLAGLTRRFRPRVEELLRWRRERQARFDAGELPKFLPHTREIRESECPEVVDQTARIVGPESVFEHLEIRLLGVRRPH